MNCLDVMDDLRFSRHKTEARARTQCPDPAPWLQGLPHCFRYELCPEFREPKSRTKSTHKAMANLIAPQDFELPRWPCPQSSDRWQRQLEGVQDFDLVTEIVGRAFKPHSMELLDPLHTLNTRFYSTQVGRISLFFLEYGAEVKVAPDCFDGFVLVEIPLAGRRPLSLRPRIIDGQHGLCRGHVAGQDHSPGSGAPALATDHAHRPEPDRPGLRRPSWRAAQGSRQLRVHSIPGSQAGRAWTGMLNHVMEGVSSFPQLLDNAMYCRHIEQVFIDTLLYGHMHNYSHCFELRRIYPALAPGYVRRAVEYLEMHAAEPVTVDMLAAAVGVSSRAGSYLARPMTRRPWAICVNSGYSRCAGPAGRQRHRKA